MRHAPFSILVSMLALAAGLLAGCDRHSAVAPPAPPHVTIGGASLITRTAVSPTAIHAGETMDIAISVENPTDDVVRATFPNSCVARFGVRDLDGKVLGPDWACAAVMVTVEWAPHETKTWHLAWRGTTGAPAPNDLVAPGDYDLVGVAWSQAPPVRITLLAR